MPIESSTYLSDLDAANPTSSDLVREADDHIRLIKSTLLNTFPNVAGQVTADSAELNLLRGRVGFDFVPNSDRGVGDGVAPLDVNAKVPLANMPDTGFIGISPTYVVQDVAARLALTGINAGDKAFQQDSSAFYVNLTGNTSAEADWSFVSGGGQLSSIQSPDVTYTVGATGDYANLQSALMAMANLYSPRVDAAGEAIGTPFVTLEVQAGESLNETIAFRSLDLSFIKITAVDATLFYNNDGQPGAYFMRFDNCRLPHFDLTMRDNSVTNTRAFIGLFAGSVMHNTSLLYWTNGTTSLAPMFLYAEYSSLELSTGANLTIFNSSGVGSHLTIHMKHCRIDTEAYIKCNDGGGVLLEHTLCAIRFTLTVDDMPNGGTKPIDLQFCTGIVTLSVSGTPQIVTNGTCIDVLGCYLLGDFSISQDNFQSDRLLIRDGSSVYMRGGDIRFGVVADVKDVTLYPGATFVNSTTLVFGTNVTKNIVAAAMYRGL